MVLVALLVVGGCSALLVVGGSRLLSVATAPVDVANDYLDTARVGGDVTGLACGADPPLREELATTAGQMLRSVEVTGGFATVSGRITLADGSDAPIAVELGRRGEGWCVSGIEVR